LTYLRPNFYYIAIAYHPKGSYRLAINPCNLGHHQTQSSHQRTHLDVAAAVTGCDANAARIESALAANALAAAIADW
jgi:hypothetical protein